MIPTANQTVQSKINQTGPLQWQLQVLVPVTLVRLCRQKLLMNMQSQARIPGYLPGQAPLDAVKAQFGEQIIRDLPNEMVREFLPQVIQHHKKEPIMAPYIQMNTYKDGEDFVFQATFEVRPTVGEVKFQNIQVEKEKFTQVTEESMKDAMEVIQLSAMKLEDVNEVRPLVKGDIAVVDFEAFVDTKPLENASGKDHNVDIGGGHFIAGFEEGLIGLMPKQRKMIKLNFPNPYHLAHLAGKPVEFKVLVKGIKKKVLPPMSDAVVAQLFAGSPGNPKTLAELQQVLAKDITAREHARIDAEMKIRLMKKLSNLNPVEVPRILVVEQLKVYQQEFMKALQSRKIAPDQQKVELAKQQSNFEAAALATVRFAFLVDAIAKQVGLTVTEAEFDQRVAQRAQEIKQDLQVVKNHLQNPQVRAQFTYALLEAKVMSFLLTKVKIVEMSKEKLPAAS